MGAHLDHVSEALIKIDHADIGFPLFVYSANSHMNVGGAVMVAPGEDRIEADSAMTGRRLPPTQIVASLVTVVAHGVGHPDVHLRAMGRLAAIDVDDM